MVKQTAPRCFQNSAAFYLSFCVFRPLQKGNHIFQAGHHRGGCRQHLLRHRGNIRHHHRPAAGGKARTGAVFRIFQHKAVCGRHIYALCAQQVNIGRRLRVPHHVAAHHGRKNSAGCRCAAKGLLQGFCSVEETTAMARPVFCRYVKKAAKGRASSARRPRSHSRTRASAMVLQRSNTSPRGHFLKCGAVVGQAAAAYGGNLLFPMGTPQASPACFQAFVPKGAPCQTSGRPYQTALHESSSCFCLPFLWHARHGAPGFYDTPALRGAQGFPPPDALPGHSFLSEKHATLSASAERRGALCSLFASGQKQRRKTLYSGCTRWQATKWLGRTSRSTGVSLRHLSVAWGQRPANLQPGFGLMGLGTSPESTCARFGPLCSGPNGHAGAVPGYRGAGYGHRCRRWGQLYQVAQIHDGNAV